MKNSKIKVAIIGAGIAGLRLAKELKNSGIDFIILEKSNLPGGRIQTIEKDGYRLDLGFQVLLDSYDELKNSFEMGNLKLKSFQNGALIAENGVLKPLFNPFKHPEFAFKTLMNFPGKFSDLFKLASIALKSKFETKDFFKIQNPGKTDSFLKSYNFSREFMNGFFRPFFGGVFLDPKLEVDSSFFLWLMQKFQSGNACLPMLGMGEIGKLMAKELPTIHFDSEVESIINQTITLKNGNQIEAEWIVNATGKQDVFSDSISHSKADFNSTTTFYLKGKSGSPLPKSLVLMAEFESPILHFCFPSEIQKSYAPEGLALCSMTLNGNKPALISPEEYAAILVKELQLQSPSINWDSFSYLAHFEIPYALPKWQSGNQTTFLVKQNHLWVGDYLAYPSINGALRSGREAGEFLVKEIRN